MKTTELIELQKNITQGDWQKYSDCGKWYIKTNSAEIAKVLKVGFPIAQDEHNARAIALVPKLLKEVIRSREALKACLRDCDSKEEIHPRSRITLSMATQQQCRAALANDK